MLAKPRRGPHPATTGKTPTLSQQHFSQKSGGANQANQATLHPNNPFQSINRKPLESSTSIAHNRLPREEKPGYSNPRKRPASSMGGWLSKEECKENVLEIAKASQDGGRLAKLDEQAVFWDENDFDSDFEDSPPKDQAQVLHTDPVSYPDLPQVDERPTVPSSISIPWSSSPIRVKQLSSPGTVLQSAESNANDLTQLPPKQSPPNTYGESIPRPTKRRTLPWHDVEAENSVQEKKVPQFVQEIIHMNKSKKHEPHTTPSMKQETTSPYPWNKTASAVKEEQKKLRQAGKKLSKTAELNAEEYARFQQDVQKKRVAKIFLSDEQKKVIDLVSDNGKSVFFTGSAGTGKSVLLREIIKVLREKHRREPDRVAVTASTGLAACNVGGVTLHSFAGIGLGKEAVPDLVKKIKKNQKAKNRWLRTHVLIIDEISMVDGDLFDKLESVARNVRNNGRPFGGIQLVITGDFFQLPPVPDNGKIAKFAFDAATWNTSIEHTIGLTQVFRQKDPAFAGMLNEMRLGRLSPQSINTFKSLSRPLNFGDEFDATELFPTRNEVDAANHNRMRNLPGTAVTYNAVDGGSITDFVQRQKLLSNCMAPQQLTLKIGAQVMLIKNMDENLVNGSLGRVVRFMDEKTFHVYDNDEDEFLAVEKLGSQDDDMTPARMKLKSMMNQQPGASTSQKWPMVRFLITDGSSRELLCTNETWNIELPNGEVQASRSQVPLILAWALSIHKAQGQTLERVKVNLGKVFEKGQAYVALSRATCQEGLQVTNFEANKVMAHERVRTFYDSLYSVHQATQSGSRAASQLAKFSSEDSLFVSEDEDEWEARGAS